MSGRHHRPTLRERLQQHQPLRFGARREYKDIGRGIAVGKTTFAIQIADEMQVGRNAELHRQALQMRARRPLARNREHGVGARTP